MLTQRQIIIREATTQEDLLIAQHFYQMWQDMGIPEDAINPDWHDITLEFIDTARRDLFYKGFVAEVDDVIIGSASCQIFAGLYPKFSNQSTAKPDTFGAFTSNHLTADKA